MYSKKKLKNLEKQFARDEALGFAYNKSDNEPVQREDFIKQLIQSTTFKPAKDQNDKRFQDSWKKILNPKNLCAHDYISIIFFTLATGGFSFIMANNTDIKTKVITDNKTAFTIAFAAFGLLIGFGIGIGNTISLHRIDKDNREENLYIRLSVRLFDEMKKIYPFLNESILKQCNPEMACVIMTLLVQNMPESDTREIQSIAENMAKEFRNINTKNKTAVYLNINRELKHVLSLVDSAFIMNPTLQDAVLNVYRGKVPATFALNQQQNIK